MIAPIRSRVLRLSEEFGHLPRTLGLVWQAARGWTIAWAGLLLLQGLLPAGLVYLTRLVVDELVAVIRDGGAAQRLIVFTAALAGLMLLSEVLRATGRWIRTVQSELVRDHLQSLVHAKSASVDLEFYDSAEFYDHLHRAREEAPFRPIALVESLGSFAQSAITLLAMSAVLVRFGWWLPALLVAGTAPACAVVLRHTVREHRWRRGVTAEERRAWYHDWLLTCREAAAELRLFALAPKLQATYRQLRQQLRAGRRELEWSHSVSAAGAGVIGLVVMSAAMVWIVWRAARGEATLGDVALFYQAFQQGLALMRTLLEEAGRVYGNALYLGNLFEFLDLKPRIVGSEAAHLSTGKSASSVMFRGVSFQYPGAEVDALREFDLTVPPGQIAAVVGANGAGKSTLVRLLCRFYDPQSGSIAIDGLDLRETPIEPLRNNITALFQEAVNYNATVEANIAAGAPIDRDRVMDSAIAAGADAAVRRLPGGYQQVLGRWYAEGSELSGGEWQRVALARAYYRDARLILLDEPTSAMDPWSEIDWMRRFRGIARGRTAIIITHRLTTAKLADVIHVMANGRIVESGTHQQLLGLNRMYAEAWVSQTPDRAVFAAAGGDR